MPLKSDTSGGASRSCGARRVRLALSEREAAQGSAVSERAGFVRWTLVA
jgi:hypothetical protein